MKSKGEMNDLLSNHRWYEMLDWDKMPTTWGKLSEETREKIRKLGKAPKYDIRTDKLENKGS